MKAIGYVTVTIILTFYAAIINGWALVKLWAWFIVPPFELPTISIPQAIGLALVVNYLTHQMNTEKSNGEYYEVLAKEAVAATVKPILSLFVGWIIKLWL